MCCVLVCFVFVTHISDCYFLHSTFFILKSTLLRLDSTFWLDSTPKLHYVLIPPSAGYLPRSLHTCTRPPLASVFSATKITSKLIVDKPHDALCHAEHAANNKVDAQCDKHATELSWQRFASKVANVQLPHLHLTYTSPAFGVRPIAWGDPVWVLPRFSSAEN